MAEKTEKFGSADKPETDRWHRGRVAPMPADSGRRRRHAAQPGGPGWPAFGHGRRADWRWGGGRFAAASVATSPCPIVKLRFRFMGRSLGDLTW